MNLFGYLSEEERRIIDSFGVLRVNTVKVPHEKLSKCTFFVSLYQHMVSAVYEIHRLVYSADLPDNTVEIHFSKKLGRVNCKDFSDIADRSLGDISDSEGPFFIRTSENKFEENFTILEEYPCDIRLKKDFAVNDLKLLIARMHNTDSDKVSIVITP